MGMHISARTDVVIYIYINIYIIKKNVLGFVFLRAPLVPQWYQCAIEGVSVCRYVCVGGGVSFIMPARGCAVVPLGIYIFIFIIIYFLNKK